jgi:hypothetical protein
MAARNIIAYLLGIGLTNFVLAQESLNDVLAMGSKPLSSDDLRTQVVGHWLKWKSPNGNLEFHARPNIGGQMEGTARSLAGNTGPLQGTWRITGDNRFCMAVTFKISASIQGDFDKCAYWLRRGDDYWSTGSLDDISAKTFRYSVSE